MIVTRDGVDGLERPLVSVVIPTRNRAHLLQHALQSALLQEGFDDFEVVVSDNYSTDDTQAVIDRYLCRRVRRVRTDRALSMPDHWEFAIAHARGEYITYLCDDDALCPSALRTAVQSITDTHASLIVLGTAEYYGSSAPSIVRRNSVVVMQGRDSCDLCDSKSTRRVLANCGYRDMCPRMLNSFCHRDVITRAQRAAGRMFFMSPDYSFAMLALALVDTWCLINRPLRLQGAFAESIGCSAICKRGAAAVSFEEELDDASLLYSHLPLKLALVTNGIANTYSECKRLAPEILRDFTISVVEYYVNCLDDIWRLRDHGVDVNADIKEYWMALAQEDASVQKAVRRYSASLVRRGRRVLTKLASESRLLFKLGIALGEKGSVFWGDREGFANILEASRFVDRRFGSDR